MTRREEGLEPAAHQGSLQQNPRVGGRRGGGGGSSLLVGFCAAMKWGDAIKNPAASFQSSWKSTGCSPCYLFALNHSSSQPETILQIFKIYK